MTGIDRSRIAWLDGARGLGIILVVYAHVLRSLVACGIVSETSRLMVSDRLIYAFHMPLFFFISGLVLRPVPIRKVGGFLAGRGHTILLPYLLWSIVQGGLAMANPGAVNTQIDMPTLLQIGWAPFGQFWFLYSLFLCQLTLLIPAGAVYIGAIVMLMIGLPWLPGPPIILLTIGFLPFFALGVILSPRKIDALLASPYRCLATLGVSWSCFLTIFAVRSQLSAPWDHVLTTIQSLSGIAGTLSLARCLARPGETLSMLGQATMPIYLLHVMASAAARTLLKVVAPWLPPLSWLIILSLVGIAVPLAIARIAALLNVSSWLGFARATAKRPSVVLAHQGSAS